MYIKNTIKPKDAYKSYQELTDELFDPNSIVRAYFKEKFPSILKAIDNTGKKNLNDEIEKLGNKVFAPVVEELCKLGYHVFLKNGIIYTLEEDKTEQFKADYDRLMDKYVISQLKQRIKKN